MDDDVKINVSAHINNIGLPCYLRAHGRACDFTATPRRPYIQIKKGGGGEENWKKKKIERLIARRGDICIFAKKLDVLHGRGGC